MTRRKPSAVLSLAALVATAAALGACAPQSTTSDAASGAPGAAGTAAGCAPGALATRTAGTLTIGTDKPAYDPWFSEDKPENGKGFESAVAFAVAERLGYPKDKVNWVVAPFGKATAPGAKDFDFDLNQVSISDERKQAVDFSSGYYDVRQAVIALKNSKAATAKSIADLKGAKLGAQVGTTSLDTITNTIRPSSGPAVFDSNDLAKAALKNGQIEALVVDLPTAFYITGAEVPEAQVVGQFEAAGQGEQFGLVLDKGSKLTGCVTQAVDALRADGTLAKLEKQWLSDAVSAPVLK
ncbi:ABC transporter substrate-binding protein [Streptomyces sp. NRRL S-350]|uniref:ABC transporter substrate-binding protein n=1 Tax=Streptomyces sp. NRRL S-350 TaxID=1463902 RepID=UPI0004BE6900|nr:ABC transporter substrate-binding protein [Streptomyces sp. NRRL S-350]